MFFKITIGLLEIILIYVFLCLVVTIHAAWQFDKTDAPFRAALANKDYVLADAIIKCERRYVEKMEGFDLYRGIKTWNETCKVLEGK
jgi:hypothetical protein